MIMKWLNRLICRWKGHDVDVQAGEQDAELTEPGEESRPVKILVASAACRRCGVWLGLRTGGITYDSKYDEEDEAEDQDQSEVT